MDGLLQDGQKLQSVKSVKPEGILKNLINLYEFINLWLNFG